MRRVHLVGGSGHGKTTLAIALVAHWAAAGLRVGTIKHTGHHHDLDTPGKDSWRHREAGGEPTGVIADDRIALHCRLGDRDPYRLLAAHYADCDVVLVEGDLHAAAPRVEVWRAALGTVPAAASIPGIVAVISDDLPAVAVPVWPRRDPAVLAQRLLELALQA